MAEMDDLLRDLDKLQVSPNILTLLALRQMLLNQKTSLAERTDKYRCVNDTDNLVKRIDTYLKTGE